MATLHEVLSAFSTATTISAPQMAGGLLTLCAGVGGVLVLAWLFQVGQEAVRGSIYHGPRALLLVIAAFVTLTIILGIFYD